MDTSITRAEHEEFRRRIEEENSRQNRRLEIVEDTMRQIGALTTSVEKLAVNMEGMLREQEQQSERLRTLEGRDGEKWRKVVGLIGASVLSAIVGFILAQIGI